MRTREAILQTLRLSLTFRGRASRFEYVVAYALLCLLAVLIKLVSFAPHGELASGVLGALLLLPIASVSVRRLHDTNVSGAALWLALLPIVGTIILLMQVLKPGSAGPNRYGPPPTRGSDEAAAPPQVRRRTHLDADGNVVRSDFVDEGGNVISTSRHNGE